MLLWQGKQPSQTKYVRLLIKYMPIVDIIYILVIIICLVFSAFFSGSETAFISLQKFRLHHLVESKVKGVGLVAKMLERPERLLSTILLGNTLVNTAASTLATVMVVAVLGERTGVITATIGMTVILLVFSEATPKIIAAHHSERLALLFARPLQVISWIFTPFVMVLSWVAFAFTRMVGETRTAKLLASEEEIRTMISVGEKEGVVEGDAAEMLHKIFEFGDRPVREVMVPRLDVVAVEKGAKISDFMELYARLPVSRFPVYEGNVDTIVGVLSVKDVVMGLAKEAVNEGSLIDELIRPPYFTPETKRIDELLVEMRENNLHMAVVVDEYGGTAGVVGLNDLVGEIVGPVGDEMGGLDKEYEVIDEHTFQVDGGMRVDEMNKAMGLELPEAEAYETVAGMVLMMLGRIPKQGDCLRYRDLRIIVTHMQGMKIEEIVITRLKKG